MSKKDDDFIRAFRWGFKSGLDENMYRDFFAGLAIGIGATLIVWWIL